jgi:hypothetical protein
VKPLGIIAGCKLDHLFSCDKARGRSNYDSWNEFREAFLVVAEIPIVSNNYISLRSSCGRQVMLFLVSVGAPVINATLPVRS